MNVEHVFFISLGIAALGFLIAGINIVTASRVFKTGEVKSFLFIHIFAGICYVSGIFCAIGFGIAWLSQYLKH
jgi:hypothetical protein